MKLVLNCGREIEFDFLDNVLISKMNIERAAILLNEYRNHSSRIHLREVTYTIAFNLPYYLEIRVSKPPHTGVYIEYYATKEECETRKVELYETCPQRW